MIITPTTTEAAAVAAKLEAQIFHRLAGDPETLKLYGAYVNLMDSLAGGTSGGALLVSYDTMVADDLAQARAVLENPSVH